MSNKFGVIEHGVEFHVDLNDPKTNELIDTFCKNASRANEQMMLFVMLAEVMKYKKYKLMILPCKKCFLDAAMRMEDAANLIRELVEGK